MNRKKVIIWAAAVVITIGSAIYQRQTGPTYPKKEKVILNDTRYELKFIRSHGGASDAEILLPIKDTAVQADLHYKYFPPEEGEAWKTLGFSQTEEGLSAKLPNQPPAGKLMYKVSIEDSSNKLQLFEKKPIVIRYKGAVPDWILVLHVIFIFAAMLVSNTAGLYAAFKLPKFRLHTSIAFWLFIIGGMIMGPVVQKYAFNEYWAGVPFGWDLTDNKMLIAMIFWLAAFLANRKKARPALTIAAAVVTLLIFLIPHSMFGSELDRTSGEITQGIILFFNF
jgi:hypothetical protein